MIKKIITTIFCCFIIFSISCTAAKPTYSRKDIENTIKELCRKEFNIEVKVWEAGDTIWVYVPFESAIVENGELNKKIEKDIDNIYLSLVRVILSMDKRPILCCWVISDIQNGYDFYRIWNTRDLVMAATEYISRGEFQDRIALLYLPRPEAIGDKTGAHVRSYDISLGEFVSFLVRQNIERKFMAEGVKDSFKVNDIKADYLNKRITVDFNIMIKKYLKDFGPPFEEVEKITKKFLKIYDFPPDIREVVINDRFNKTYRFYTRHALMNE
jgi:hypothetical protein